MSTEQEAAVLQVRIANRRMLHSTYVPAYARGGIFVPTAREFQLGTDIMALVILEEDGEKFPVRGKVASVTFSNDLYHTPGFSFHLATGTAEQGLRKRCEEMLSGLPASACPFLPR